MHITYLFVNYISMHALNFSPLLWARNFLSKCQFYLLVKRQTSFWWCMSPLAFNHQISLNPVTFLQSTASSHSRLPPYNQPVIDWTKFSPFFNNQFHSNVHHNTERKICRYFSFIATSKNHARLDTITKDRHDALNTVDLKTLFQKYCC